MTSDKRLPLISAAGTNESRCPGCQRLFVCEIAMGKDHCWCMDLPAKLPVDGATKCLCPECLKHAIEAARGTAGDPRNASRGRD